MNKNILLFTASLLFFHFGFGQVANESFLTNRFRVEFQFGSGGGLKNIDLGLINEKGDKITISTGGGLHVGGALAYLISRNLELGSEFLYQSTKMSPPISNASGSFERFVVAPFLKYIFNISDLYKLNLGAAVNIVQGGTLDFDASKIPPLAHNIFTYKTAIGPKLLAEFEIFPKKIFSYKFGLKYYSMNYEFNTLRSNGYLVPNQIIPPEMMKEITNLDGSGIEFSLGIALHL